LHVDRAAPETARYDLCCVGRLASKHALIAEKAEGHHAHLASILNGVHRRNRGATVKTKAMSGAPSRLIQDLEVMVMANLVS
jgi:hypothetical protein